jgi:hypothetical protein
MDKPNSVNTIIVFLDIIHCQVFLCKTERFADWIPSPSSGKKATRMGPINWAILYLSVTESSLQNLMF